MKSFWKSHLLTVLLVACDFLAFSFIWRQAWAVRSGMNEWFGVPINPLENYTHGILWKLLVVWLSVMAYNQHYAHRGKISSLNQIDNILKAGLMMLVGTMATAYLFKPHDIGRSVIFFAVGAMTIYVYAGRTLLRSVKQRFIERGHGLVRAMILGAGTTGHKVSERLRQHPEIGYELIGFIDDDPAKLGTVIDDVPVLADTSDLVNLLLRHRVEEVFIAMPNADPNKVFNLITHCEEARVHFKMVTANILQVITHKVKIDDIGDLPVIPLRVGRLTPVEAALKRLLDLGIAIPMLALSAPLWLMVAILIRLDSKGPAIFIQNRVGQDGRLFRMFKFRTMRSDAEPYAEAPAESSDPRVTRLGRFLRKTSIDELPQLLNVIKGEMSMVGPRPEMPFIVETYEPWQRRRLNVPPGMTGLWQIAGRKKLPMHLNLEYDFYYIRNWTLLLDIEILLKTGPVVLLGQGAF